MLAALLIVQPVFSWAGTGARVIPQGKVSLLEEGKEVSQFQSELPLPEGTLMLCNGSCLVQTQSLQLVAQDRAVFALAEGKARWDLTVKSGQVDFSMRPDAKPVSFHTPHDTMAAERAIMPAGSTARVRGSVRVTERESLLSIQEGALQVMSPDGTMLVQPGQALRLAAAPAAATSTRSTTYAGLTDTQWAIVGGIAGAGVIAAVTAVILANSGGGDGGDNQTRAVSAQ